MLSGRVKVLQLREQCQNLEVELDDVKAEIVKLITEKTKYLKENEGLKVTQLSYEQLEKENQLLRSKLEEVKDVKEDAGQNVHQRAKEKYHESDISSDTKITNLPEQKERLR